MIRHSEMHENRLRAIEVLKLAKEQNRPQKMAALKNTPFVVLKGSPSRLLGNSRTAYGSKTPYIGRTYNTKYSGEFTIKYVLGWQELKREIVPSTLGIVFSNTGNYLNIKFSVLSPKKGLVSITDRGAKKDFSMSGVMLKKLDFNQAIDYWKIKRALQLKEKTWEALRSSLSSEKEFYRAIHVEAKSFDCIEFLSEEYNSSKESNSVKSRKKTNISATDKNDYMRQYQRANRDPKQISLYMKMKRAKEGLKRDSATANYNEYINRKHEKNISI